MERKECEPDGREPSVPKLVHFIWVGNTVPEEYLKNIHLFTSKFRERGYEVVLWTDDARHYDKAVRKSPIYSETGIPGLEVKNISHIVERAIYDYKGKTTEGGYDKGEVFSAIVDLERVGLHNYAMVSDLLRYELLRQQGGVYLDVDNKSCSVDEEMKKREASLSGFKIYGDVHEEGYSGGNDILSSSPGHAIVSSLVDDVLHTYSACLDYKVTSAPLCPKNYKPFVTVHDARRSPGLPYWSIFGRNSEVSARKRLTMDMSGPDLIGSTLTGLLYSLGLVPGTIMLQVPYMEYKFVEGGGAVKSRELSIDGVGVKGESALLWVAPDFPTSFDDTAMPLSRGWGGDGVVGSKARGGVVPAGCPFPLSVYGNKGLFYNSSVERESDVKRAAASVPVPKKSRCARFCEGASSFVRRICGGGSASKVADTSVGVGF